MANPSNDNYAYTYIKKLLSGSGRLPIYKLKMKICSSLHLTGSQFWRILANLEKMGLVEISKKKGVKLREEVE